MSKITEYEMQVNNKMTDGVEFKAGPAALSNERRKG